MHGRLDKQTKRQGEGMGRKGEGDKQKDRPVDKLTDRRQLICNPQSLAHLGVSAGTTLMEREVRDLRGC